MWCPSHVIQSFTNFSNAGSFPWDAVLQELLQCRSLPRGAVFQEQTAPAWIPDGVTGPAGKPGPAWALHGVTASFRAHPPSLEWSFVVCRGTACFPMVSSLKCSRTFSPKQGAPPPPSSSPTLVAPGLFLSHFLTLPSQLLLCYVFYPFLNVLSQRCYQCL